MMHAASIGLGVNVRLLAEAPDSSAAQVVHDVTVGDYTDPTTVRSFAAGCDVVTFDHEHVPTGLLRDLESDGVAVRPGPAALVHAQDKAIMRERLAALGAPCPVTRVVPDAAALAAFGDEQGWPIVAKTSRGGYDGKGVWRLDSAAQAREPFAQTERWRTDHRRGVRGFRARTQCPRGALTVRAGGGLPDFGICATQWHLCRDDHTCAGAR